MRMSPTQRGATVWGPLQIVASLAHQSNVVTFMKASPNNSLLKWCARRSVLKTGNRPDSVTDLGPMSSERQLSVVERHVNQAINNGAVALTGGERLRDVAGAFYPPTILTNVTHEMDVMREETFGPVLPIMTFKTDDEAVRLAE